MWVSQYMLTWQSCLRLFSPRTPAMAELSRQNSVTDFLKTTNTDVVSALDSDLKKLLHIAPEADREVCVCAIPLLLQRSSVSALQARFCRVHQAVLAVAQ